ncbi:MAG: response regulator [Alphaproteobacteria bacterium]|nr:response regulator [Alphaproteobacteria bacterium]MBV9419338.1 response regulator [Alphaproteobacteria bacterium]MBV9905017.1 response regulator [Alphaproteobacteria bacterium]
MSGGAFDHLKALVVEDNQHMRALLRSLLNALGVSSVFEATNGEDAFDLLRDKRPDLVLTDLSMKPMDGITFAKEVRTSRTSPNPYVPIIMVTGHTERLKVEAARDAGVTEVLAKPITAGSLFTRIAEIVERPRPFVKCPSYFGPDRRRKATEGFTGPFRRREDFENDLAVR